MKYRILEHKADLKIKVFGKNKQELFFNALFGMQEALCPKAPSSLKTFQLKQKIKVNSPDLETLLVEFLSEALYLIQTKKVIYDKAEFRAFTENKLEADLTGRKIESFEEEIKAVTYHELNVCQKKDGSWEATVLFDI